MVQKKKILEREREREERREWRERESCWKEVVSRERVIGGEKGGITTPSEQVQSCEGERKREKERKRGKNQEHLDGHKTICSLLSQSSFEFETRFFQSPLPSFFLFSFFLCFFLSYVFDLLSGKFLYIYIFVLSIDFNSIGEVIQIINRMMIRFKEKLFAIYIHIYMHTYIYIYFFFNRFQMRITRGMK